MFVIKAEKPACCQYCGEKAELRPYGPLGEFICFPCGMKDPEATEKRMKKIMKAAYQDGGTA